MKAFGAGLAACAQSGYFPTCEAKGLFGAVGKAAAFVLVMGLLSAKPAMAAPAVGKPAPDFVGSDAQGVTHALADYRGSTVVLEWTNHECPYTAKHYEAGAMQALQAEAKAQGIVWFSIVSSAPGTQGHVTPNEANELTQRRSAAPTAVILDAEGAIARAYDARTTPHMFIIDPQGELVYMGAIDDAPSARSDPARARNYVRLALGDLAAGRRVTTASTQPYGCSIKYAE